jgi:lambda repressor-like predicted transcriptional regulator
VCEWDGGAESVNLIWNPSTGSCCGPAWHGRRLKLLGISRKTGYRWRAENGGLPPGRLAESSRSGRYLSLLERQRIATLRERGLGVREIARRLGRSPSTISRELRRHLRAHDRGIYDGDLAHTRARERSRRPRRPLLAREPELRRIVQDKLEQEWSPAQIAANLRETYPDRPAWHLCHETIYQAFYHGGKTPAATASARTGPAGYEAHGQPPATPRAWHRNFSPSRGPCGPSKAQTRPTTKSGP